jgi:hypothetical protein
MASVLAPQIQLADAGGKSPYDSGYDHGCDDAGISDPSDRYINEPGKGQAFILMNSCKDIMLAIMLVQVAMAPPGEIANPTNRPEPVALVAAYHGHLQSE